MSREEVFEGVRDALLGLGVEEEIVPEASLMDDLELESIQIYELLAELEARFRIRIPEKVLMHVDTVQDMADTVADIAGVF